MKTIAWAFLISSLVTPVCISAADFSGQVISILDSDTIEVLHNQHPE